MRGESNPSSRATDVEIGLGVFERVAAAKGVRRPNDDWELRRGAFSLFSGDEYMLEVMRDERRELVRRVRHADGETCSPNSFREGGGARLRPKVDQFPRRSMKPRLLGVVLPKELLEWLSFGESESPLAAVGAEDASDLGRLFEPDKPRRTGGGSPWRVDIGSAAKSSGRRSISGKIFRAMGADSCVEASWIGSSLTARFMSVGVVVVIVAAGAERPD